jgi:uncharacterized protein YkwD
VRTRIGESRIGERLRARGTRSDTRPESRPESRNGHRRAAALALVVVALALAGCNSLYSSTPAPSGGGGMRGQLVSLHNGARAAAGLGGLTESGGLDGDAQYEANRLMYASGSGCDLVHSTAAEMTRWYGGTWAENIACEPNTTKWACASMSAFHDLFMGSPPHRANILNGGYGHVGVGVACGGSFTFVAVHFTP